MAKTSDIQPGNRYLLNISIEKFVADYALRIDLDADYQREKIWSTKQQELLIDSVLLDIDIPKIYLVEVLKNKQFEFECIDGKQRINTLLRYFKPDPDEESPLTVRVLDKKYTFKQLKTAHPSVAKKIENYELSFSFYKPVEEEFIREIFRRLQLGIRLNSGELLKSRTGTIRDFIYKEIGSEGPFLKHTSLSEKRFSRQFTLTQIILNSFSRSKDNGEFVRARLQDIEDFFEENHDLDKNDSNLVRIKKVLKEMDAAFKEEASIISSRAVAVSTFLFVEEMIKNRKIALLPDFVEFLIKLLNDVKDNMDLLSKFQKPKNAHLLDEFQKYVIQASVEAYSIKRRHEYLLKAFKYYTATKTRGQIIAKD